MNQPITTLLSLAMTIGAMAQAPTMAPADGYPDFAMGGDLSWTTRILDDGSPLYYIGNEIAADQLTTIPEMVYDHGFDAVRLRVWVDPNANEMIKSSWKFKVGSSMLDCTGTCGYDGSDDLLSLATTFAMRGARIMVAFHLSDTFADPARQFIPASWQGCATIEEMAQCASEYVESVLQMLYDNNVNVAWVQIGNETSTGMLKYALPDKTESSVTLNAVNCEISNTNATGTQNFVKVFQACSKAAKSVFPEAKTLIHFASSDAWSNIKWALSTLEAQGFGKDMCDMIGLSLYPCPDQYTANWKSATESCISAIENIYSTYGYRSIICEIGMNNEWSYSASDRSQGGCIEQCNKDVRAFTEYLIENLRDNASCCDGFFYWEPETDYLDGYTMGACVQVDPGDWARKSVTANDYWGTVKENSTFPAGGLVAYENAGVSVVAPDVDIQAKYYNLQGVSVEHPEGGLFIRVQGNKSEKIYIK